MTSAAPDMGLTRPQRDWRIWFGVSSTVFWLWLGLAYVSLVVGWQSFITQPSEALGSFLEGAFAPLAFLWLVIGFFLQQGELTHNTRAIELQYEQMRRQAENAEIQARAISANELHQRQETLLLVADRVHKQLGAIVGLLWMSSQGPGNEEDLGDDVADEETVAELWSRLGSGDPEAFARNFMALHFRAGGNSYDLFFGTEVRTRHSNTILDIFGRLLKSAESCDPDGLITGALRGGAHGFVHEIIRGHKERGGNPPA